MMFISKLSRYLLLINSRHNLVKGSQVYKFQSRNFNVNSVMYIKMYMETENKHAYDVMQNQGYVIDFHSRKDDQEPLNKEEYSKILDPKYLNDDSKKIFQLFSSLGLYCSEHNLCISNKQFDDFIDKLTDSIHLATDEELKRLFYGLTNWPETESIRTRNYIEVWSALDDECHRRINKWSYDQMLEFVSLFYMLNVARVSDFCFKGLQKFATKAKHLTKNQIVKTLFFIGIARSSPHDIHNLEVKIEENFQEFSIDELAIIAMGFFKSKTPIRSMSLVNKFIDQLIDKSKGIHEVTLAALLKIIRYSIKISDDDIVFDLLTSLQKEIPRLSIMCNVQVALVGTSTLTFHEQCLNLIEENLMDSLPKARLKDLERLMLTYGTFNYIPKTENFLNKIVEELRKQERTEEIKQHSRVYACCVSYLGLLEIYPTDLINKILSKEFLEHTYGKNCYFYGREILTIHNMAKIFCKDSVTSFITDNQAVMLAKKYTDYTPDENYPKQYNALERMFLDIMKILQNNRGGNEYAAGFHILPHHQKGDIIICNNNQDIPLPVQNTISKAKFGLPLKPFDSNKWIALIVANRNPLLKSGIPIGQYAAKIRELNTLGFYAALVNWNIYSKLQVQSNKITYLNYVIEEALNKKQ